MSHPTQTAATEIASTSSPPTPLSEIGSVELAQALMERLKIPPEKWHRLKSNRKARSEEQLAGALVFLLKDQPEEALVRLKQAIGWLDRSISAPPCPTHKHRIDSKRPPT